MDKNGTTYPTNNKKIPSTEIINTEEYMKIFNTGQKKDHDKSDLILFKPKNSCTTSPASTNMVSEKNANRGK